LREQAGRGGAGQAARAEAAGDVAAIEQARPVETVGLVVD